MKMLFTSFICLLISAQGSSQTILSADLQIQGALLASPTAQKEGATIYGYSPKGKFMVLRKGTNNLICIADDPNLGGFSAACYHSDLEPFMARGRELREEGKNNREIFDMREEEVRSGALLMPDQPTTLYVYSAPEENYNTETGVVDGTFRYVVYVPYATGESVGLPTRPEVPGMPWLMDEGTHRAHIMINPE